MGFDFVVKEPFMSAQKCAEKAAGSIMIIHYLSTLYDAIQRAVCMYVQFKLPISYLETLFCGCVHGAHVR